MDHSLSEKNNNLMTPADPYSLCDLIPLEDLQQLQDTLAEINKVTSLITDRNGHALTMPSNEMTVCALIRRSFRGEAMCSAEFQTMVRESRKTHKPVLRACEALGFLNAAVPIRVNEHELGYWWVRQQCASQEAYDQIGVLAKKTGLDLDVLLAELERLPECDPMAFKKTVGWVNHLVSTIAQIGFQNHLLSLNTSKLDRVEGELHQYKTRLESLVQERTAELIRANNQLEMEVLERNLAEEQIERKSKLLDAINQVLKHTLDDDSDEVLTQTFLNRAMEITNSPFAFIVERKEQRWSIMALSPIQAEPWDLPEHAPREDAFNVKGPWRELIGTGKSMMLVRLEQSHHQLGLPDYFPELNALLAVPLLKKDEIIGILGLANNRQGYHPVDRTDIEVLARAFVEALLRKRMERDKAASEKRLNLAMHSANEGLWDYAPREEEIYFNPSWFSMLGYQTGELPSSLETWGALTHPEDFPRLETCLENAAQGKETAFRIEIRMLAQEGHWHWIQAQGRSVDVDKKGRSLRIVGTLHDISRYKQVELALQKANEELQRLAALDGLTQIANRLRFDDRLLQEWRRARRDGKPLALVLGDIDYFKEYNDTYGHIKGDETLYAVAQAISATLKRPMDMVARYGGEEFAILLPNTNLRGATQLVNEVRTAIDALNIEHKTSRIEGHITLSFGVAAIIPDKDKSARELVQAADKALYKAKNTGRNRVVKTAAAPFPDGDNENVFTSLSPPEEEEGET